MSLADLRHAAITDSPEWQAMIARLAAAEARIAALEEAQRTSTTPVTTRSTATVIVANSDVDADAVTETPRTRRGRKVEP